MKYRHIGSIALAAGLLGACGMSEEKIAEAKHRHQLIKAEKKAEEDAAALLKKALGEPSVESIRAILPLTYAQTLLVDINGTKENAYSVVRRMSDKHPEIYNQALIEHLINMSYELPDGDIIPSEKSKELLDFLKVLADRVSEKGIQAGKIPSITLQFNDSDGKLHTVSYLYPFGDLKLGSNFIVTKNNLKGLVSSLGSELGYTAKQSTSES